MMDEGDDNGDDDDVGVNGVWICDNGDDDDEVVGINGIWFSKLVNDEDGNWNDVNWGSCCCCLVGSIVFCDDDDDDENNSPLWEFDKKLCCLGGIGKSVCWIWVCKRFGCWSGCCCDCDLILLPVKLVGWYKNCCCWSIKLLMGDGWEYNWGLNVCGGCCWGGWDCETICGDFEITDDGMGVEFVDDDNEVGPGIDIDGAVVVVVVVGVDGVFVDDDDVEDDETGVAGWPVLTINGSEINEVIQ